MPNIVCQVIGFRLAQELFNLIDDQTPTPNLWKGDLNVSYSFGGSLKQDKYVIHYFVYFFWNKKNINKNNMI